MMEDSEVRPKKQKVTLDRVALKGEALDLVQGWAKQIREQFKGIKISHAAIVEFKLTSQSVTLSPKELATLKERHYDELSFMAWAVKELRAARARGESLSVNDLIGNPKSNPFSDNP